jgi:hypothetical protein
MGSVRFVYILLGILNRNIQWCSKGEVEFNDIWMKLTNNLYVIDIFI